MSKLLTTKQAADYLNVSADTLRKWNKSNKLVPLTTTGGHRRYQQELLDEYIGISRSVVETPDLVVTYSRVSSHEQKQKGDLERQKGRLLEYCVNKKYEVMHIFEEVGSGMSDTRSKLNRLCDIAEKKEV